MDSAAARRTGRRAVSLLVLGVTACQAPDRSRTTPATPAAPTLSAAVERDVRLLRATLLTDSSLVTAAWEPGTDPTGRFAEGEIVWSPRFQRGVLRVIGLPANDSTAWQYQLWLVDRQRGEPAPVDGGRFTMPPGQVDRLIAVRPSTPVPEAIGFYVTVAQGNGQPASARANAVMTATPK